MYSPSTSAESPAGQAALCRLPFSDISEAKGGFILYPSGERQDDPASIVALPGNQPGQIGLNPGLAVDTATHTWVPVPAHWLAPGGLTYAYMTVGGQIRAVDVRSGTFGDVTTTGGWYLIATLDTGVFATKANDPGAWFVPFGEAPRQVVSYGRWDRYDDGALWGEDASSQLVRHDLTDNIDTSWGTVSSASEISGFDSSRDPVVLTGGALVVHHADGSTTSVWPGTNGLSSSGYVFGDPTGIWFEVDASSGLVGATGAGIYVWTSTDGARIVSGEPVHVMGSCL